MFTNYNRRITWRAHRRQEWLIGGLFVLDALLLTTLVVLALAFMG
jgi:hypothetical protein